MSAFGLRLLGRVGPGRPIVIGGLIVLGLAGGGLPSWVVTAIASSNRTPWGSWE